MQAPIRITKIVKPIAINEIWEILLLLIWGKILQVCEDKSKAGKS
jgi:hypothetical protein